MDGSMVFLSGLVLIIGLLWMDNNRHTFMEEKSGINKRMLIISIGVSVVIGITFICALIDISSLTTLAVVTVSSLIFYKLAFVAMAKCKDKRN